MLRLFVVLTALWRACSSFQHSPPDRRAYPPKRALDTFSSAQIVFRIGLWYDHFPLGCALPLCMDPLHHVLSPSDCSGLRYTFHFPRGQPTRHLLIGVSNLLTPCAVWQCGMAENGTSSTISVVSASDPPWNATGEFTYTQTMGPGCRDLSYCSERGELAQPSYRALVGAHRFSRVAAVRPASPGVESLFMSAFTSPQHPYTNVCFHLFEGWPGVMVAVVCQHSLEKTSARCTKRFQRRGCSRVQSQRTSSRRNEARGSSEFAF